MHRAPSPTNSPPPPTTHTQHRPQSTHTASSGGATRDERLGDVGLVVLDEVHYLGDPNRGSVWEEVIINCPRHITLLAMSATVKNPDDLGGWISQVGGWGWGWGFGVLRCGGFV